MPFRRIRCAFGTASRLSSYSSRTASRVGKADRRKGFLADKVADNDGIRRVVHHLKQISQHQRKRKENDLQGRTPRNALRIGRKYRFIDD